MSRDIPSVHLRVFVFTFRSTATRHTLAVGTTDVEASLCACQAGMKKAEEKGSDLRYSYMFWLPWMAVFREGIETIIFLAGTSSNYEVRPRHQFHCKKKK